MFGRNQEKPAAKEGSATAKLALIESRLYDLGAEIPDLERKAKRAKANHVDQAEALRRARGDHMIGSLDADRLAAAEAEANSAEAAFLAASAELRRAEDDRAVLTEVIERVRVAADFERAQDLRRRYLELLPRRIEQLLALEDTDRQLKDVFYAAAEAFPSLSTKQLAAGVRREIPYYAGLRNTGGYFEGKLRVALRLSREMLTDIERMLAESDGRGDIGEVIERMERELGGAS